MTPRKPPHKDVASLVFAALIAAGTIFFTFGLLAEYGTTTGSWTRGALDGLRFAWLGLVLTAALAANSFLRSRGSRMLRRAAVAVAVAALGGSAIAGAAAAKVKYDQLPRTASCVVEEMIGGPGEPMARHIQDAYDEMDHPARLSGGGSSGVDGCSTSLLDVRFSQAAAHYRHELPRLGWDITRDDETGFGARRGELLFVLRSASEPDPVPITIETTRIKECHGLKERVWEKCMFAPVQP